MISISLCMIVKNEEDVLKRCLECFKDIVDEIIIVDTGSTDKTKEIAKEYTKKVYDYEWINDFSMARNFAFSKASKEYTLWMDADEVIEKEDQEKLIDIKMNLDNKYDSVTMQTWMGFDENGKPTLVFKRNRLVKTNRKFKWYGFVHEYIAISGKIYHSDIAIKEMKVKSSQGRNLKIYNTKIEEGVEFTTRDINYYGKELFYNELYDEAIEVLLPFIEMNVWIEDKIDAICKISDCYFYKKDYKEARKILAKAFEVTQPRAEVIYRIGLSFENEGKYEEAIYFYLSILNLEIPKDCYGFISPEFWEFKPYLQLSVCYYKIGDIEKSIQYHKKCMKINPNNSYVKYNEEYFNNYLK